MLSSTRTGGGGAISIPWCAGRNRHGWFPRSACPLSLPKSLPRTRYGGEGDSPSAARHRVARLCRGGFETRPPPRAAREARKPHRRWYENSRKTPHPSFRRTPDSCSAGTVPHPVPGRRRQFEVAMAELFHPLVCRSQPAWVIPAQSLPRTRYGAGTHPRRGASPSPATGKGGAWLS